MKKTLNQLVIFAARSGNLELLEQRVSAGGDVNYVDPQHGSALVEAIRTSNVEVLDWLIVNGADVNIDYGDSRGPLEIALRHPVPPIVRKLVLSGAKLLRTARPYYRERLESCLQNSESDLDGGS